MHVDLRANGRVSSDIDDCNGGRQPTGRQFGANLQRWSCIHCMRDKGVSDIGGRQSVDDRCDSRFGRVVLSIGNGMIWSRLCVITMNPIQKHDD